MSRLEVPEAFEELHDAMANLGNQITSEFAVPPLNLLSRFLVEAADKLEVYRMEFVENSALYFMFTVISFTETLLILAIAVK